MAQRYSRSPSSRSAPVVTQPTPWTGWDTNPNKIIAVEISSLWELGKTRFCASALAERDGDGKIIKHHSAVGDTEHKAWIEMDKVGNPNLKLIDDMNEFRAFVDYCLQPANDIRVVCIDSGTDLRAFAETEFLAEQDPPMKRVYPLVLYGRVFNKIDEQIAKLNRGGKHVVFTARVKEEFEDEARTGRMVRDSYKKIPFQLPVIITLQRGIRASNGRVWFPTHVFGEVIKNSPWKKFKELDSDQLGKPWLFDVSMEGVLDELVKNPWDEKDIIASAHKWLHDKGLKHDEKDIDKLPQLS